MSDDCKSLAMKFSDGWYCHRDFFSILEESGTWIPETVAE